MAAEKTITVNEKKERFEYSEAGEIAFIEYELVNNSIAFLHTCVPEAISGKGIAALLAGYAFKYAKEKNLSVIVSCSYIKQYVKKHPELEAQRNNELDK